MLERKMKKGRLPSATETVEKSIACRAKDHVNHLQAVNIVVYVMIVKLF